MRATKMHDVLSVTWLGQASFTLEAEQQKVLIDPFLSEHEARLSSPPPLTEVAEGADVVLITHEHLDHLDLPFLTQLVRLRPAVTIVLPEAIVHLVSDAIPQARLHPVNPGDEVGLRRDLNVKVVPAYHGVAVTDGYSDGSSANSGPRFVGYILRLPTMTLYHSGDTLVTSALLESLAGERIDIALLPINGRDFFRERAELVGNMSAREAVHLAHELDVRVLIPMHWDLFRGNTERPATVLDEATAIGARFHVIILAPQKRLDLR